MEWLEIVVRSLGAILMLFILTRILGKKQISQLTFFEYITGITLGELAGFISTDIEAHYTHGVAALGVWFIVPLCIELITLKSIKLRRWLEGTGTVLVKKGKVMEHNLKKERYTANELMEQLRSKNVFQLADVEFAMLEASGELSIMLKPENQPLTPKHLGLQTAPVQEPQTVIIDGKVMDDGLAESGRSRAWLAEELEKIGVTQDNVFIGQVDTSGTLYVDLYDDMKKLPDSNERMLLLATLKKCEAELTVFALLANDENIRELFKSCAGKLGGQIEKLTPLLKR